MSFSTEVSSPFQVSAKDIAVLEHNDAFQSVRQRMARKGRSTEQLSFCDFHREECTEQQQAVFQLHRDVICALLLPLFEIHDQATQVATRTLGRRQGAEPERAFRGEARGAFTWLHCILMEERDFCLAEGCPACVVLNVLSSEPTIRLVTVACLLCDYLPATEFADVKQKSRPDFGFWLKATENAVCEDSLWGDAFWPEIEHRARSLVVDIGSLVMQCAELRTGSELQKTSSLSGKSSCSVTVRSERHAYRVHVRSIPVQPSVLTRRQLNMLWEEQELVSKFLQSYWRPTCWSDRRQRMLECSQADYPPQQGGSS